MYSTNQDFYHCENYQIHYSVIGDINKPIIMFLHGFMGNIYEFDLLISLLKDSFSCLVVDLPGHGKTQVLGNDKYYSMENTAQTIINLLDNLQINKCFLVGYSMGGRLGLYLALKFPHRFPQIVLESASPGLADEKQRLNRQISDHQIARKLIRLTKPEDFLTFLINWYQQPIFGNIQQHPQFDNLITTRLSNSPPNLAKSLQIMGTGYQPSLWNQLENNINPILLLVGKNDQKFVEINQMMVAKSDFCRLKLIPHAAHNIHFVKPLDFVQEVKNFFGVN
ncbi:2-succinyl-6-hydroxy-2,4-cyclohexadiene-1-carboxylate synthase [Calothrix sp. PCC 6303]|uniref:2-succinyl-6-hydroxy-2, 4-cyclohexadiene-1-carboxylate synthase n=1 Tax=Calothrix sp. PCC 6303 TaxID=1170562 RepID=UPI0002A04B83|nr:2-succinyl-6-hydroxy-2,4-cyclohexadiene-1-carboxylate synthase [Calothrix sp. PCC 6303]AFZ02076.1 2-succinyl-6-hydroxy-2,4-cyclohexadiene-1-carbox ylatesynthase [Calothrix sp. PCC 6303]